MSRASALIISLILLASAYASASDRFTFAGEEDTLSLCGALSAELLNDPSGEGSQAGIMKLIRLSHHAGRMKTAVLFRECAGKIHEAEGGRSPEHFALNFYADFLERDPGSADKTYKGVEKWLLSGPWHRYGKPDLYAPFQPELKTSADGFRGVRVQDDGMRIYPFGFLPERRGIVYASASFSADIPVRIWVDSNAQYRLFINGVEVAGSEVESSGSLECVSVKGARGYTLLLKISGNTAGDDPYFRVILTDAANRELKPDFSGAVHRGRFTYERIFSSQDLKPLHGSDVAAIIKRVSAAEISDINRAYSEARDMLAKYPLCSDSYEAIMPLLVKRGNEREFAETLKKYRGNFPDSDYFLLWESLFYKERDKDKFMEAMERLHPGYCDPSMAGAYIKLLSEKGDNSAALSYSGRLGDIPSLRETVAGIEKRVSPPVRWRKFLLERMTSTGDPIYYRLMGDADMDDGLDPVLYWEKALSINSDMRSVRDAVDIFENSGDGITFYSGRYTDLHPEFLRNGIKRKVTVRIFANGNFMTECEDLVPPGLAAKGEFTLLKLMDTRVLYALKCSEGEARPLEFETADAGGGKLRVKVKSPEGSEFLVLRYTGYSSSQEPPFYVMKSMDLCGEEDISEIALEVISEGVKPVVTFMERGIAGEKSGIEGVTMYRSSAKFNFRPGGVTLSAAFISGEREFSSWYSGMLKSLKMRGSEVSMTEPLAGDIEEKISAVREYMEKNFTLRDGVTFEPRFPDEVIRSGHGTSEELAIISSIILEKNGVKGFISFISEKGDSVSERSEAALYIPESKGKGYWIRFSGAGNFKKGEALVIRGDGFEKVQVSGAAEEK